ncbi:hypothetical protein [Homoserinibacter sp. GY 40078]|uniref:hypothetical protein n=1 Tax=Homoserinibacter sp. GY 40078 TaxID=2603275 RepID=UPI0011CA4783|nr:hypothetical protein [Homoserinibacter sp. GY 40078]TXK17707.1 hypothetical protein FVQ89_12965 [Homoserinibacter sp. GY 40078]
MRLVEVVEDVGFLQVSSCYERRVMDVPKRQYQVWAYSVTMGRLLLRSNKSEAFATRVDILFQNVHAMKLLTALDPLVVAEADSLESEQILAETGLYPPKRKLVFLLRAGSFEGYVVAGVCFTNEDSGEYYDPSPLWIWR